jgi:hypothetical protein
MDVGWSSEGWRMIYDVALAGGASRNWSNRVMYAPGNTALETVE